jgi:hypothetical protein
VLLDEPLDQRHDGTDSARSTSPLSGIADAVV